MSRSSSLTALEDSQIESQQTTMSRSSSLAALEDSQIDFPPPTYQTGRALEDVSLPSYQAVAAPASANYNPEVKRVHAGPAPADDDAAEAQHLAQALASALNLQQNVVRAPRRKRSRVADHCCCSICLLVFALFIGGMTVLIRSVFTDD